MNRDTTLSALFDAQSRFEEPSRDPLTVTQFADEVRRILDNADDNEPIRCAWCLSDACDDSEMGTTAGDGGTATTIANGHALCLDHFRVSRKQRTYTNGPVALEALRTQ